MEKTEFQLTGYVYKRSNTSTTSWSLRYTILSTDTGAVKLYAEKSGIRTIKEQFNVRKGRLNLDSNDKNANNKSFEFQIVMDEPGENQNIVLAAMNAVELSEWTAAIDSCCSMGEGVIRRRHLINSPMTSPEKRLPRFNSGEKENNQRNNEAGSPKRLDALLSSINKRDKNLEESSESISTKAKPPVRRKTSKNKSEKQDDEDGGADNSSPSMPTKVKTSKRSLRSTSPSIDSNNESAKVDKKRNDLPPRPHRSPIPIRSSAAEFDDNEGSSPMHSSATTRRKSGISKLGKMFDKSNESEEDSQASTVAASSGNNFRPFTSTSNSGRRTPSPAAVEDDSTVDDNDSISSVNSDKRRDFKGGGVKIVKFRNLLNSNGLDLDSPLNPDRSLKSTAFSPSNSENSSKGFGFDPEVNTEPEVIEIPKPKEKYNPKTLPIQNRPTGNLREGYLEKFDVDLTDSSDDSWIKQFVTLDISLGTLCLYAEINGRKIARGKFNILASEVDLYDKVHHGKAHAFKLFPKSTTSTDGTVIETAQTANNTAVLSADDRESLHYWLISFDDCSEYLVEKARQDELDAIAAAEARVKAEIEAKERAEAEAIAKAKADAEAIVKAKADAEAEATRLAEAEAKRKADAESEELKRTQQSSSVVSGTPDELNTTEQPKPQKNLKDLLAEHSKELHHVNVAAVEKPAIPVVTDVSPMKPAPAKFKAVASMLQMSLSRIFNQSGSEPALTEVESAPEKPAEPIAIAESRADEKLKVTKTTEPAAPLSSSTLTSTLPVPPSEALPIAEKPAASVPVPVSVSVSVSPVPVLVNVNASVVEVTKDDKKEDYKDSISTVRRSSGTTTDGAVMQVVIKPIPHIKFAVHKVRYPAERLARRIKIWYCSSGFSLSTEQEIEQFVNELQQTGDSTLQSFSQEKFDNILDWAHLLEVLRKYEGKMLVEEALEHDDLSNSWVLNVKASIPSKEGAMVSMKLSEASTIDVIARELAQTLGVNESDCAAQLPGIITAPGNNPIQMGLEQLKDDLIFAEDLVLYQEEVIDHLWESYTALKSVVEQKDDVINQLYSEVTDLKEKSSGKYRSSSFTDASNLLALANHEESRREAPFSSDGGGREEWRNWADEKHKLIQSHNEVKSSLINEIRTLRKTLNPNTEQTFLDLQKSENIRFKLEEELVRTQIQCDQLRSELSQAQVRNQELETEKTMLESDWQDRYNKLLERQDRRLDGQNQPLPPTTTSDVIKKQAPSNHSIPIDNKVSDVPTLDSALYGDPSVGIISRLNLVESKVKLFDNKFNDNSTGSLSTFPFPTARSKSVYVPGIKSGIAANTEQSSAVAPQQASNFPGDLSARNSFPPGSGVFNISNKPAIPEDNTANIQQLAERISSSSILVPSSNPRNSFNNGPTLSDLASFHPSLPQQQDDKISLSSAAAGDTMSYEEKKTAPPNFSSQKLPSFAITPYSQNSSSNHSLALYDPSYPEFKRSSSVSPPRRQAVPKPGSMMNYSNLSAGSSLMDPQQRQVTMRIPASAALLNASSNDHPLRNALRSDTFNKLNGKGITMMTTRPYFKFNPKAKASYGESRMMDGGDFAQAMHPPLSTIAAHSPRFMSDTSSSHKRTASWDANPGPPATVSGRRVLLNRNSGGWKWK